MGERQRGGGLRAALIAAAVAALPGLAYAQDSALDLESRITALEQRAFDAQQEEPLYRRVDSRSEPPRIYREGAPPVGVSRYSSFLSVVTDRFEARSQIQCLNAPNTPRRENVRRIVSQGVAIGSASFNSNAQETEDGESDVVANGVARLSWTRRSERGLCASSNPERDPSYDPQWSVFANVTTSGNRYLDRTSAHNSRVAIALGYTTRLGEATVARGTSYRERLTLQVTSAANYVEFYDNWSSDTYDARATYSRAFSMTPEGSSGVTIAAGHVFANPDRNSYDHASIELQRSFVRDGWTLRLAATAAYRDYENAEPISFDETRYTISAVLSRRIADDVSVELGINLDARESDISTREFEAASAPITIGFSRTF